MAAGAPAAASPPRPPPRGGPGWALLPGLLAPGEVAALRQESDGLLAAAALAREGGGQEGEGGEAEGGGGWGWVAREFGCVFQVAPGAPAGGAGPPDGAEAYFRRRAAWSHSPGAAGACVANPRVLRALRAALPPPAAELGPVFLVNEQHLVKPPAEGGLPAASAAGAFPAHRDEDWLAGRRVGGGAPYYSLWVALDPMGAENGGLELPGGPPDHRLALVPCAAGDAVLMDSRVLHRSGPNRSGAFRRAYMPQFSLGAPLVDLDTGRPVALAVPLAGPPLEAAGGALAVSSGGGEGRDGGL